RFSTASMIFHAGNQFRFVHPFIPPAGTEVPQIEFLTVKSSNAQWEKGCSPGFVCRLPCTNRPSI
ncbi:MAG: hypothetical protein WBS19_18165, partial [Candidatus Korobacteraceae bacterium]